jgi:hypothetical protein
MQTKIAIEINGNNKFINASMRAVTILKAVIKTIFYFIQREAIGWKAKKAFSD